MMSAKKKKTVWPHTSVTVGLAFVEVDGFEALFTEAFSSPLQLLVVMKPLDSGGGVNEQAVQ